MPILAFILAAEISLMSLLVALPSHLQKPNSKVLGTDILIAQDTFSTDTSPPSDNNPTPASNQDTPIPANSDTNSNNPTAVVPTETPSPVSQDTVVPTADQATPSVDNSTTPEASLIPSEPPPTLFNSTSSNPTQENPSPSDLTTLTPDLTSNTSSTNQDNQSAPQENIDNINNQVAQNPILNTQDVANHPDKIDKQSLDEAQKEDAQLSLITDPAQKATVLTHTASNNVVSIDSFTATKNFSSVSFVNQRLNNQIDQLSGLAQESSPNHQSQMNQHITDLCQQTNTILRSIQETVPEDIEQDLEITRSKCLVP